MQCNLATANQHNNQKSHYKKSVFDLEGKHNVALPQTTIWTKFFYGFGSVAYGVKDNGFSFFLLLYYNQVLGLPLQWVGTGIFAVLIFDSISDPIVGRVSDNLHSKWGRRHPFMYAAVIPVALSYFFLWNPPEGISDGSLFAYFIIMAAIVRTTITLYEIPSSALVAELTDDYDERTSFLSFRYFFGWWGGLTMAVLSYQFLLVPTDENPIGILNKNGYQTMGLIASCIMVFAILTSCLGTHKYIPYLRQPPAKQPFSLSRTAHELWETLSNRSFIALFAAAIFAAMSAGMSSSLDIYLNTFFWEMDNTDLANINLSYFGSALFALVFAPFVGKKLGKKKGAIIIAVLGALMAPSPYVLRFLGWFPENGTPEVFWALLGVRMFDVMLIVASSILIASMVADIVEESELKTGRRSEGLFFAARNFIAKSISGVGVLIATTVLTFINFPEGAKPGQVDPEVVLDLGMVYAPLMFCFYMMSVLILFAYRISREDHSENLRRLAEEGGITEGGPAGI